MSDAETAPPAPAAPDPVGAPAQPVQPEPRTLLLSFRGTGGEYFRIWIVNLALTVLTLGIYSAWATVRTRRYFRGNTFLGDHSFDYHASPVRILIGRTIALVLLISYNISVNFATFALILWIPAFLAAFPWLINSSQRFNARNTSYRNVRFNFGGRYFGALKAYVLWPLLGVLTLGALMPLARRVGDYYYVNNHSFGGRPFRTGFTAWRIYAIFLIGAAVGLGLFAVAGSAAAIIVPLLPPHYKPGPHDPIMLTVFVFVALFELVFIATGIVVATMVFNLVVRNTVLDGRHKLRSRIQPLVVAWIAITNVFLMLVTLGIYYPWALVRLYRYRVARMALEAQSDLDEFVSESFGTQSAVGEEIAGFFDLDFGL
jgi:uncharacterized membrane protein YjgN (DUF898 family)